MNRLFTLLICLSLLVAEFTRTPMAVAQDTSAQTAERKSTPSSESRAAAREIALQRCGLRPYRIEIPDVVKIVIRHPKSSSIERFSGARLVDTDGTVQLANDLKVRISGLSIEEARQAIEQVLSTVVEEPEVRLTVIGYNSKVAYVIWQETDTYGDEISEVPCTTETNVRNAILRAAMSRESDLSNARVWVIRRTGNSEVLDVDWKKVKRSKDHATNHMLLPGDRVFVATGDRPGLLRCFTSWCRFFGSQLIEMLSATLYHVEHQIELIGSREPAA